MAKNHHFAQPVNNFAKKHNIQPLPKSQIWSRIRHLLKMSKIQQHYKLNATKTNKSKRWFAGVHRGCTFGFDLLQGSQAHPPAFSPGGRRGREAVQLSESCCKEPFCSLVLACVGTCFVCFCVCLPNSLSLKFRRTTQLYALI